SSCNFFSGVMSSCGIHQSRCLEIGPSRQLGPCVCMRYLPCRSRLPLAFASRQDPRKRVLKNQPRRSAGNASATVVTMGPAGSTEFFEHLTTAAHIPLQTAFQSEGVIHPTVQLLTSRVLLSVSSRGPARFRQFRARGRRGREVGGTADAWSAGFLRLRSR